MMFAPSLSENSRLMFMLWIEKYDMDYIPSLLTILRLLLRAIIFRLSIHRLKKTTINTQDLVLPLMKHKRFDKFLIACKNNLEKLFGFESWTVFLINHGMNALFTILGNNWDETDEYENILRKTYTMFSDHGKDGDENNEIKAKDSFDENGQSKANLTQNLVSS